MISYPGIWYVSHSSSFFIYKSNKLSKINSKLCKLCVHVVFALFIGILFYFFVMKVSFLMASFPAISSASSPHPSPRKGPTGRKEKAVDAGPLPLGAQVRFFNLIPLLYLLFLNCTWVLLQRTGLLRSLKVGYFAESYLQFPSALFSAVTSSFNWPIELLVLFMGQKRNKHYMRDGPSAYKATDSQT